MGLPALCPASRPSPSLHRTQRGRGSQAAVRGLGSCPAHPTWASHLQRMGHGVGGGNLSRAEQISERGGSMTAGCIEPRTCGDEVKELLEEGMHL